MPEVGGVVKDGCVLELELADDYSRLVVDWREVVHGNR